MELTKLLKGYQGHATGLTLDYEHRQRSRQRVRLDDGRSAALMLPRGTTLRDGDCVRGDNGRIVRVHAAPEPVSTVMVADPVQLARAAYHLGNRHEPLQVGDGWLRYREDHVLDAMLREQGLEPCHEQAPFEPERGAYGHEHSSGSDPVAAATGAPVILVASHDIPAAGASGAAADETGDTGETGESGCSKLQLLRLASPALPIGAFAYSQGLEQAVEWGWISDETSVADWLLGLLAQVQARQELPLFARLYRAWADDDSARSSAWNATLIALRETAELRAEERDTGAALARLLADLGVATEDLSGHGYVSVFALAAVRWNIPLSDAAGGFLWSWCQNQVAATIRLAPIGQTAGQRILQRLIAVIPEQVATGLALDDDAIGFAAPGLAIASARHEHQYTRLFLS